MDPVSNRVAGNIFDHLRYLRAATCRSPGPKWTVRYGASFDLISPTSQSAFRVVDACFTHEVYSSTKTKFFAGFTAQRQFSDLSLR